MEMALKILLGIIAYLHLWFLALEMFLWRKRVGLRTFRMTPEKAEMTKVLASNQGLYNGFLAAGLFWGLLATEAVFSIRLFFLSCVAIAGIFGAATVSRKIFFIQALPALVALAMLFSMKR